MHARLKNILIRLRILRWIEEDRATAFIETVVLMPVFITLLMGVYDLGRGVTTNQKVIGASQIIGDLITRERTVDMATLEDMIVAGELAIAPYATAPFGYDIASVQFDDDGNPEVLWRITRNTVENDDAIDSTRLVGSPGDGIVVVTATYEYRPFFSNFIVDTINMEEVAFLHGRRSATIACADCPVP